MFFNISINKPKHNRTIGRPKRRQEDNIKIVLKEKFCDVNWIELASDNATSNVTGKLNITSSSILVRSKFQISAQNLTVLVTKFHSTSQSLFKFFQLVFQNNHDNYPPYIFHFFFFLVYSSLYSLITIVKPLACHFPCGNDSYSVTQNYVIRSNDCKCMEMLCREKAIHLFTSKF
jgi:hypothetical protein